MFLAFHIAPGFNKPDPHGHSHGHMHNLKLAQAEQLNTSHSIQLLHFGTSKFPKQTNPLDNINRVEFDSITATYKYFVKIVPTTYVYENGDILNDTYQYSVTKSEKFLNANDKTSAGLPGVVVMFDISPIMVKIIEKPRSFSHFMTGCCAIVGGVFTIAGLIDSFVFKYRNLYKKSQMNKLT